MESTVYNLAAALRKTEDFGAVAASLAALAPRGSEFVNGFKRVSISRAKTARYLLREIEHAMRATAEVTVAGPDRVHLEHIYPQTPASVTWPNHNAVVNRLGNLTLLGKRMNISIRNAEFDVKKKKAYENSDILMTRELTEIAVWDTAAIEARQLDLSRCAFDIWRFGGEVPPEPSDAPPPPEAASEAEMLAELPEVPTG